MVSWLLALEMTVGLTRGVATFCAEEEERIIGVACISE